MFFDFSPVLALNNGLISFVIGSMRFFYNIFNYIVFIEGVSNIRIIELIYLVFVYIRFFYLTETLKYLI